MNLGQIRAELQALADPAIAAHSARFFRTGPGEYGEGDRFLGIRVPRVRALAKRCAGSFTVHRPMISASAESNARHSAAKRASISRPSGLVR